MFENVIQTQRELFSKWSPVGQFVAQRANKQQTANNIIEDRKVRPGLCQSRISVDYNFSMPLWSVSDKVVLICQVILNQDKVTLLQILSQFLIECHFWPLHRNYKNNGGSWMWVLVSEMFTSLPPVSAKSSDKIFCTSCPHNLMVSPPLNLHS